MAVWLLDSEHLGRAAGVKRIAGRLLKQPAREGVVEAQSRLGRLLCRDCDSQRDRRIGFELLRQAARAGDCQAQLELGRLYSLPQHSEPAKARLWLEQAAAQGSQEAARFLQRLSRQA
ncbi:sel1 repeat family protein [Stutzerimonas stutzeri]|uniref:tetratricopeptide repeat protein n=1 Tax=Stutzerimonas sp. S1 TaxID=3030652 RepID=UPI0022240F7D|nr:sel1 repeat family protein [Stutzerimonas sp. S1]MCW3148394.1 sel1 repeat family protein [Stutzerimonas sp. S1]